MSRVSSNIIEIDGVGFQYTGVMYVNAILGIASANSPAVAMLDKNNINVFPLEDAVTGQRFYPISFAHPQRIENLKVDVFTNMKKILVYVDRFAS